MAPLAQDLAASRAAETEAVPAGVQGEEEEGAARQGCGQEGRHAPVTPQRDRLPPLVRAGHKKGTFRGNCHWQQTCY